MSMRLIKIAAVGAIGSAALFAAGCASESEKPYSITGQPTGRQDAVAYDQRGEYQADWVGKPWLNPRYNDEKGHYHPEWVGRADR
jgi:hypothetical protein